MQRDQRIIANRFRGEKSPIPSRHDNLAAAAKCRRADKRTHFTRKPQYARFLESDRAQWRIARERAFNLESFIVLSPCRQRETFSRRSQGYEFPHFSLADITLAFETAAFIVLTRYAQIQRGCKHRKHRPRARVLHRTRTPQMLSRPDSLMNDGKWISKARRGSRDAAFDAPRKPGGSRLIRPRDESGCLPLPRFILFPRERKRNEVP